MTDFTTEELPSSRTNYSHPLQALTESKLAARFMRLRKPAAVQYEFSNDPGLLQQYYRLREEMFISVWGLEHFSGQKDEFDDVSQIMVARRGLHCIAGGRLTISTPSHPQQLPMEQGELALAELFPELNLEDASYGEFSRLAILPEFRGGTVFPEIARRFISRAVAEGVDYAFNIAPLPLARSYRQAMQIFGLQWKLRHDIKIPDREEYEGIKMVMSVMDLTKLLRPKTIEDTVKKSKRRAVIAD